MLTHEYDSNATLAKETPERKSSTLQKAFKNLYDQICLKEQKPTIYRLDNEISADSTSVLQEIELHYQLVPPDNHRCNLS